MLPISYASVVIGIPLIFICGVVVLVGDHKFRDSFNKAWKMKDGILCPSINAESFDFGGTLADEAPILPVW